MRSGLLVIALGACAAPPATVADLRITAPSGAVEVVPVPDEQLALAWTARSTGAVDLALRLVPDRVGDPAIELGTVPIERGQLGWSLPSPAPRPGTYRVAATAVIDGEAAAAVFANAIVFLQGVEFRDRALTWTSADVERDIWITATVGQPIDVTVVATGSDGALRTIARSTIASDLAPIGRVFRWTGTDLTGAPFASGPYAITVEVDPRIRPVGYTASGLTVDWTP